MICRLCLKNINANNAVYLFETDDTLAESSLLKMIAKFLQLEVSFQSQWEQTRVSPVRSIKIQYCVYPQIMPDDNISTNICNECCEHLEDFNNFWQLVEQKQGTLKKEFLNVDVDCVALKWTGGIDVDVSIDELPLVPDEMDEKPLDIHNLSLLGSVLDVNVDSVEVPQISAATSTSNRLQDNEEEFLPTDHDFDMDEKPLMDNSSESAGNHSTEGDEDDDDGM